MKKIMTFFGVILFASCFLISCGNSNPSQDSIALVEKGKQDSSNSLIPEIKVNIYVRTDVGYDSEGWPMEMGKVVLVKDFQEKKEYQLNGDDYIEKIEIVGQTNDMTLQFINGKSNKILHEEIAISLNGTKMYTTSDPAGEKHKYYQDWLNTKWDALIVKVSYKDNSIFEGKINPSNSTEKVEGSTESTESIGVVTIGSQVWTSENLNVSTYRNGDVIPQVHDEREWRDLTTGAWCYYDNDASNGTKYGKLYNWYAVNDPRGLAPNGYHIPTDAEWTKLCDNLGGEHEAGTNYSGGESEAGTKMKSTSGWYNYGDGTNSSGFSGLPGGFHNDFGTFGSIDYAGYWWSSTGSNTNTVYHKAGTQAWGRYLRCTYGDVNRNEYDKRYGLSVRCLRD